jgi:hypothetical protein
MCDGGGGGCDGCDIQNVVKVHTCMPPPDVPEPNAHYCKLDVFLICKISNPIYLLFSLSARDMVAVFVHGTGRNNSSEGCSMRSSVGSQLPPPMHDNGTPAAQTRWRGSSCLKLALARFGVFVGQWGAVCWRGGEGSRRCRVASCPRFEAVGLGLTRLVVARPATQLKLFCPEHSCTNHRALRPLTDFYGCNGFFAPAAVRYPLGLDPGLILSFTDGRGGGISRRFHGQSFSCCTVSRPQR